MKMSLENRMVILASAVAAGLVGWGILRRPQSTSLFGMLNADVRRFLQWPLFTIGKSAANAAVSDQVHGVLNPAVTFFAFISEISC